MVVSDKLNGFSRDLRWGRCTGGWSGKGYLPDHYGMTNVNPLWWSK